MQNLNRNLVSLIIGSKITEEPKSVESRWGAHLMLQTRMRVLDGALRAKFQSWYPGLFDVQNPDRSEHALAA